MQTCPECGGRNEDGELFCGSCGAYLEWEESQAAADDALAPAEEEVAAGTPPDDGGWAGSDDGAAAVPVPEETTAEPAVVAEEPATAVERPREPEPEVAAGAPPSSWAEPAEEPADDGPADDGPADDGPADEPPAAPAADEPPAAPAGESPAEPAVEPAPAAATTSRGGGAFGRALSGGGGGRASSMLRRAADQATGGAVSRAASTSSRARGMAKAPGGAATSGVGRVAGQAPVPPAARGMLRGATTAGTTAATRAGAKSAAAKPAAPPAATPAAARPAAAQPAPARPAPSGPGPAKPAPRKPEARKPGAPAPRRPVPTAAEEEPPPKPGDLICGACGAGNAPHRNFCRRCGASLVDAPVQPQRSWWRRLLRPDPKPGPVAGTRKKARRGRFPTRLVVGLVVLGLLGAAAWIFRGPIVDLYGLVVDRVAQEQVRAGEPQASSQDPEHPPALASDGANNTYWAPAQVGADAVGQSITFPFGEPIRLAHVEIIAGASADPAERDAEAWPTRVGLTMTVPAGEEYREVDLNAAGGAKMVRLGVDDVSAVTVTILAASDANPQGRVAVAEVGFLGR